MVCEAYGLGMLLTLGHHDPLSFLTCRHHARRKRMTLSTSVSRMQLARGASSARRGIGMASRYGNARVAVASGAHIAIA